MQRTVLTLLSLLCVFAASAGAAMLPTDLRCEYLSNPVGVDVPQPRLSWKLASDERGQYQEAYQVLVSTDPDLLRQGKADLWDSGKVESRESVHVVYEGKPLESSRRVYWTVQVWDRGGKVSQSPEPAFWETALMNPQDWTAQWISRSDPEPKDILDYYKENPVPLFRKTFGVEKPVARARAYIAGLGYYELYCNGTRVGDQWLDPAWTVFGKRVFYSTFDITDLLRNGKNAVGVMLGNGWYNPLPMKMFGKFNAREALTVGNPRVVMQLLVEYQDGSRDVIATDPTWKAGEGPILKNNIYLGELYDARREQPGWASSDFDDAAWSRPVVNSQPLGALQASPVPPIRITRELAPVNITEPTTGVYVVDFGQNFAGSVRLKVQGPAGTRVHLRYGELVYPDGMLNGMTAVYGQIKKGVLKAGPGAPETAFQEDTYILKGEGLEEYLPRFTFRGFRYVELSGFPGKPAKETLTGLRMNTDVEPVGTFACSNEQFNRIQGLIDWTFLSNLFSVQSDCPHREKLGYGGDIVASSEMAMFNFDMATLYPKIVWDFADDIRPNGGFTETAPYIGIADRGLGEGSGPVGWGTAHPLLLWQLYQYYGNARLMEQQYPYAQRWLDLLQRKAEEEGGTLHEGISDHESVAPRPVELTSTAFYYYNALLMHRIADLLGKEDDASRYYDLSEKIKATFNERFLKADTGVYDSGTQACQAFALYMGLVPDELRGRVLDVLVKDIQEKNNGGLSTGIFGTKYMLNELSEMGRSDVAFGMVNRKEYPGWGYMLENGATTLWESWTFHDNYASHNHPMFGSVSEWFFKALAGIQPDPSAAAFDRILIKPTFPGGLTWARASYDSIRGTIRSEWQRVGTRLTLSVTVPPNTSARVFLPARDPKQITESGLPVSLSSGIEFLEDSDGRLLYEIGSGRYEFAVEDFAG